MLVSSTIFCQHFAKCCNIFRNVGTTFSTVFNLQLCGARAAARDPGTVARGRWAQVAGRPRGGGGGRLKIGERMRGIFSFFYIFLSSFLQKYMVRKKFAKLYIWRRGGRRQGPTAVPHGGKRRAVL
jgi:hypothetical protein